MTTARDRHRFREHNRKARLFIKHAKLAAKGCVDCGYLVTEENHPAFDWDHVDPNTKTEAISRMRTIKRIREELKKCVLRCRNCHAIKTWKEEAWKNRREQVDEHPSLF